MTRTKHATETLSLAHVGGLIALLLVASTSPASAWQPLPAEPEEANAPPVPEVPPTDTGNPESSQNPDEATETAQLRPYSDVWQPANARAVSTKTAPSFVKGDAPPASAMCHPGRAHASTLQDDQSPPLLARRAWLACRYPHAPPRAA